MKIIIFLFTLFIKTLLKPFKINHSDYVVDLIVGGKNLKLNLDPTKSVSILTYEGLESNKITNKTLADKPIVEDQISISGAKIDYSYLKGDKMILGLGANSYGDDFSLSKVLKKNNINTTRSQFAINDNSITFDDNTTPLATCGVVSTKSMNKIYKDAWACDVTYMIFNYTSGGEKSISQADFTASAIFDYRKDYISIPKSFQKYILTNHTSKANKCIESSTGQETTVTCLNRIADYKFYLELGNSGVAFRVADFTKEFNDTHSELLIRFSEDENVWVLGKPFLKGHTISFDEEKQQVGISGGEYLLLKQADDWYDDLWKKAQKYFWIIIICTIACSLLLIIIIFLVIRSYRRKRLEEHGPLINERV
jgi:hypothetical protein